MMKHIASALCTLAPSVPVGQLPELVDVTLHLLESHGMHRDLKAFPSVVAAILRESTGELLAHLAVGHGSPEASAQVLQPSLQRCVGSRFHLETSEDSSLVGGVVLRIGDDQIDGSVRTQLLQLSDHLKIYV